MDFVGIGRAKYRIEQCDVAGYTRIKHVYIPMRDGVELCGDIFLPFSASRNGFKVPVIFSMGPYGKDVHAESFGLPQTPIYADMYKSIRPLGPDACFELADPLIWAKEYGYALLRVDCRGIGGSQGILDPWGLKRSQAIGADAEGQDLYDCIEWAGGQSWCNGKVVMSGISYYGMTGYWAAMQQPPHLAAVISYEAAIHIYQVIRRGGIHSPNFHKHWYNNIVRPYQSGKLNDELSEEQLEQNRVNYPQIIAEHEYPTDKFWKVLNECRQPSMIKVPFLSAGNWADAEFHLPGNIISFNNISSTKKWLEMHTGDHLATYYLPEHLHKQRQFLDTFALGKDCGLSQVPRLRLTQRCGPTIFYREGEASFPPADAADVAFILSPTKTLVADEPSGEKTSFEYEGLKGNVELVQENSFEEMFEIIGSPFLQVEVSTDTADMDIFVYLRSLNTDGNINILQGNHGEPMDSFARGYFRLSHRDEVEQGFRDQIKVPAQAGLPASPVERGRIYFVTIPFMPTAYMFKPGEKLQLEIGAQNTKSTIPEMRSDDGDRTLERFGGKNFIMSHGKLFLPRVRRT